MAKITKRLKEASQGDRMYERPMMWDEADQLIEILARTERNRDMWKSQCERQAARLWVGVAHDALSPPKR